MWAKATAVPMSLIGTHRGRWFEYIVKEQVVVPVRAYEALCNRQTDVVDPEIVRYRQGSAHQTERERYEVAMANDAATVGDIVFQCMKAQQTGWTQQNTAEREAWLTTVGEALSSADRRHMPPRTVFGDLDTDRDLVDGEYDPNTRVITLCTRLLGEDDAFGALAALVHEARHHLQYEFTRGERLPGAHGSQYVRSITRDITGFRRVDYEKLVVERDAWAHEGLALLRVALRQDGELTFPVREQRTTLWAGSEWCGDRGEMIEVELEAL